MDWQSADGVARILVGDCLQRLRDLPDCSVQCCVTSPPYWGLRDYGNDAQLGLESTPEKYVENMVAVFREVKRILRNDGTLWLNLGDSYFSTTKGDNRTREEKLQSSALNLKKNKSEAQSQHDIVGTRKVDAGGLAIKPKDLVGVPWRVAFALQADGWWLRQDVIWCLSGGTVIYARTQKGDMPMMLRDAARLDPATVKLWNGEKWTQVLGWSRTARNADELELVLRSGERIACTPTHQFPTGRGLLRASEIVVGDTLQRVTLPQPDHPKLPDHVGEDAAWLAGLYLAEGSMSGDKIQISGNASQVERFDRVSRIAASYGGSATVTIDGNNQNIRVYGKLIVAIIRELVSGKTAKDKCLSPVCWRYGNDFLRAFLDGYLSGDGHHDEGNGRWRLGFTRNYNLERDLRTLAARIGFHLTLKPVFVDGFGKKWPAFKGEIRFSRSGHHNEKDANEVVEIRRSRCREVYDVGVEDDPHLFALASGILTHNSKPNPMPESVTDRCTKAHEYVFLLTKSERYFYDAEAIKVDSKTAGKPGGFNGCQAIGMNRKPSGNQILDNSQSYVRPALTNRRSVWKVSTKPYKGAHFATMPPDLVEPCILAGTSEAGCCESCGAPLVRQTSRTKLKRERPNAYTKRTGEDGTGNSCANDVAGVAVETTGWLPSCECNAGVIPCLVLDPFGGSGTTVAVAAKLGRRGVCCELNPEYVKLAIERITPNLPSAKHPLLKG